MKGKIDTLKVVKKASRDFFSDRDTRTRVVRDKKKYTRKQKYKSLDI
jgi:hypothetical protein